MEQRERTILDQFEWQTVEHYLGGELQRRPGWCFGEFVLFQNPDNFWEVWSKLRGLRFPGPGIFSRVEDAAAFVLEMAKLKNNWSGNDGFPRSDVLILEELSLKHGALPSDWNSSRGAVDPETVASKFPFLNGAKREDYT